jgi:hypothetical protein
LGSFLPPAAQQQISNQKLPFPLAMVMQIKGDKGYSTAGLATSLLDFAKQQITVMDPAHKLFATVYMKDFPAKSALRCRLCRQYRQRPKRYWNL